MPHLLAEKSSLAPQHVSRVGSLSLEEDMSLDGRSQGSPESPHVPHVLANGLRKSGSNGGAALLDPSDSNKTTDISNGETIAESASQVHQSSVGISHDERNNFHEPELSVTNGGPDLECSEQEPHINGNIEEKSSPSATAQDRRVSRHAKEDNNASQVPAQSNKLNSKKKTALSPKLQTKVKDLEKDRLPSPKSVASMAKDTGKERAASPRLPSPGASAGRAKGGEKGQMETLHLPTPVASKGLANGKVLPFDASPEVANENNNFQDTVKLKDKTKPLSQASMVKRPALLSVKAPDSTVFSENAKPTEKASPNSLASPNKSNAKASLPSPHKPSRTSSSSEKTVLSVSKFSPGKPPSRHSFPESPVAVHKNADKKTALDQERNSVESEKMNQKLLLKRKSGVGSRKFGDNESIASSEYTNLMTRENPNLGPYLLKLARQAIISGDNPQKALNYASRAAKSYEIVADGNPSLDLVMSLHILAATYCTLGQFEEAIPVLQHSIAVTDIEVGGQDHALAAFAGSMQLGDTYSLLGRGNDALAAYHEGLEVQKKVLGEMDPRVGETCRYLAEAHTQAMQFDQAEALCQHALNIHKEHSAPASIEEATDRRLMGLICNGKGVHEAALEHLVLASMALIANAKDVDVAAVDTSIGDTYVSLGRFDEAVFSYQKALTVFKASKGENNVAVASVYVSLAELYLKTGKFRECKTYCDSALRIFNKQGVGTLDEVASGLTELAVVFEALNEQDQALLLLKKALSVLDGCPGQQCSVAGVEAQIGVLSFMSGNYVDARSALSNAVSKLRGSAEKTSALFGIVLNQMGLCCLHLSEIRTAVQLFEESRSVMETACGPHHPDTLTVYSNLAGAYDALGRLDDAVGALQHVVEVREEELGTANSEIEDERSRLAELLREAGRLRARRLNNTLGLLMRPKPKKSAIASPGRAVPSMSVSVKG